jgi:assimilatory nitrate reductase catalytic subunit
MKQFGYGVFTNKPEIKADYYSISKITNGFRAEWANLTPQAPTKTDLMIEDALTGRTHALLVENDYLVEAIYLSNTNTTLTRSFIEGNLGEIPDIPSLLAGFPLGNAPDKGAIICACYQVGLNEIIAGSEQGLKAGTNCGSCFAEVKMIVNNIKKS